MAPTLETVLTTLRAHQSELRGMGVAHIAIFGSLARREANEKSDVDVLLELDENRPMGIFQYSRLKLRLNDLLNGAGDIVNRKTIKPLLRESILRDAIHAF